MRCDVPKKTSQPFACDENQSNSISKRLRGVSVPHPKREILSEGHLRSERPGGLRRRNSSVFRAEHAPEEAKAPDRVHPLQDLVAVWELRKVSQFHLLSGALVCNFCQSFGCLSLQGHELTVRVAPEQPLAQKSCTGSHRWWASPYNLLISKEKIAHLVRNTSCARERLFTLIASGGGSHHFGDCHETRIPRP